ncbi:MAG: bifunctional folylpolyglutamate synthase/dihydrofolate synthase [Proteobacteria bacterium]|nr:bifunctional folylpolyglutamate synthase/dihydrofolate synthase [Pseudomonadota bacterium]
MTPSSSDAVLERLTHLHPKVIDLSLERVQRLLDALGAPQARLPPVVHLAGTNGKGSTIAFLRAFLEAAGYRVHIYISPHLVRFNERVRLAGKIIEDEPLIAVLEECETANGDAPITFFEITTAAAFLAFSRTPADIVLLETGLGGRLDATNVVERPVLTVLTPIAVDHTHYLGATLSAIAAEKAGILKPGVPAVVGPQPADAGDVIAERARALGAPLSRRGAEWSARATATGMAYRGDRWTLDLPAPRLQGAHQIDNAGIAIACLEKLASCPVGASHIERGLRAVDWPGRLQLLTRGRLAGVLPAGWELWLDGGHNADAARVLAAFMEGWRDKPLYLIFGMLNTKDPESFLKPLARLVTGLRAVAVPGERATLAPEALCAAARAVGLEAQPAPSVAAALKDLVSAAREPARLLVSGSLYLVGAVLAENG